MKRLSLHGMTFHRLTVIACNGSGSDGAIWWNCQCECGNQKSVRGSDLKRGFIMSCGCWNSESNKARSTSHGGSHTRLYRIWQAMRDRTGNPKASRYSYYGGRGIPVCAEWQEFATFQTWALANGYSDHLSIDRYPDNDGNYEPGNCRWATQKQQVNNSRKVIKPERKAA